jgi:hypothetical protein
MKADYARLWEVSVGPTRRGALIVSMGQDDVDQYELIQGAVRPAEPLVFRRELGWRPYDVIATTGHSRMLFSSRLIEAMSKAVLTGWSGYPVRVFDHRRKLLPGYHALAIHGRAAPLDDSRMRREVDRFIIRTHGLYFRDDFWDGSDFFLSRLYICVTQRAFDVLSALKPTNLEFTRLDEVVGLELPGMKSTENTD